MTDALEHTRKKFFKTFKAERLQGPPGIKATPGAKGIFIRFQHRKFPPRYEDMGGMGYEIFTHSKIARIHEEGGIVKAEGGKLAVPLSFRDEMFTAKGRVKKQYKDPKRVKGMFRIANFLAKRVRGDLKMFFVLKNKIKIRPRLGFMMTWEKLELFRIARLNKAVSKALMRR